MKLNEALVEELMGAGLDRFKAREIAAIEAGGDGCTNLDPSDGEQDDED